MEQSKIIVTPSGIVDTDSYAGSCSCGGTKNYKYNKGRYLIYFLPKRKSYHIKDGANYIKKNEPIGTLCDQLKSLGFPYCEPASSTN